MDIYIFNNFLFYVSRYGRWIDLHLLLILVGLKISLVILFDRKNDKIRNEWMTQLYFASSRSENKI